MWPNIEGEKKEYIRKREERERKKTGERERKKRERRGERKKEKREREREEKERKNRTWGLGCKQAAAEKEEVKFGTKQTYFKY